MSASWLRPKHRALIPGSFLVRAMTLQGPRFHCHNCGERMFVRFESGLCPMCFNGRRPNVMGDEPVVHVSEEMALAGVLDDPVLEEVPGTTSS